MYIVHVHCTIGCLSLLSVFTIQIPSLYACVVVIFFQVVGNCVGVIKIRELFWGQQFSKFLWYEAIRSLLYQYFWLLVGGNINIVTPTLWTWSQTSLKECLDAGLFNHIKRSYKVHKCNLIISGSLQCRSDYMTEKVLEISWNVFGFNYWIHLHGAAWN